MTKMPSVGKKHKDPKKHPQWIETIKNIPSESKALNISRQSSIQIHDLDSFIPTRATPSKPVVTTLSIPAFWKNSHEPSRGRGYVLWHVLERIWTLCCSWSLQGMFL